jgi:hypothetical protein
LDPYEKRVGFRLRDAFATVGSNWTAWSTMADGGGIFPDSITAVTLADPAKFEEMVAKAAADGGIEIEEMTFRTRKIRYTSISLKNSLLDASGEFSYPLAWFLKDNTLFLSTNPLSLKRQILRFERPVDGLARDERWSALAAKVSPDEWESWSYMDLGRSLNIAYTLLEPFVHLVRDLPRDPETGELIVDLARMPLGETLADLVGGTLTNKRTLPNAIVMDSWSNTGASISAYLGVMAVVAAVAIPGLLSGEEIGSNGGVAQNEMMAETGLQFIRQAQETFKNSDSDRNGAADFWTRDVAGLYALRDSSGQAIFLLDPPTAQADSEGAVRHGLAPAPKNGYFYRMMVTDPDGEAYQKDDDKDGSAFTHPSRYGVAATPAQYGATGRFTFITNETGEVWKKDTQGKPVAKWPGKDPAQDGWQPID